jgi:hypothetical protein
MGKSGKGYGWGKGGSVKGEIRTRVKGGEKREGLRVGERGKRGKGGEKGQGWGKGTRVGKRGKG